TRPPRPGASERRRLRRRAADQAAGADARRGARHPLRRSGSESFARRARAGAHAVRGELAIPVDDASALEVVRGQLDLDAVARKDADPVATHLACGVAEGLVTVVERDPVHPVPERLHDLALQLDLVFLLCQSVSCRCLYYG